MRGAELEVFEVDTSLELPSILKVGAMYFVKQEKLIVINHGSGQIVTYASTSSEAIVGVIPIEKGGTGVSDIPSVKQVFGVSQLEEDLQDTNASITSGLSNLSDSVDAKITAQQQTVTVMGASLASEIKTRQLEDNALSAAIDAVSGKLRYIQAHDFGSATPTYADLAAWAVGYTGLDHVQPGTTIVNEFDSSTWVYDDETQSWTNIGIMGVSQATNESLGVIKGSAELEGAVIINADGVPTLPIAVDDKLGLIRAKYTGLITATDSVVGVDEQGQAFVPSLTDDILGALTASTGATSANAFATKQDVANGVTTWNV